MSKDYLEIALQYIDDVLTEKIPACIYVKQACQRQLDDLHDENIGFIFDEYKARHICQFVELLPHIKGELRGEPIELEPPQIFILTTVFGWVDSAGNRRFKTAYIEWPRKNAKSTLSSGVALYCLVADGEGAPEVYSAATTRDQARIVFNDAAAMVRLSPGMRKRFSVGVSGNKIPTAVYSEINGGSFKPLSRDQGGNLDGLNTHCCVIDELHAHKTREIYDVIDTSTSARKNSLIWLITTAGFNRAGICYEQRGYVLKILSGAVKDDSFFGVIYTIDPERKEFIDGKEVTIPGDDWTDPISWQKANPLWGVSVVPEDIERKARKAMEVPTATNNFLTKNLNVWVNADYAWMDMRKWDLCANHDLKISDFADAEGYIGIDLSSKIDIASKVILFKVNIDGVDHFYCFDYHWLPEETVETSANSQYKGWVRQGLIEETDGAMIDINAIQDSIEADNEHYPIEENAYDPFQATQMAVNLTNKQLIMVEVKPTVQNFSDPMKLFEALVISGRFHHTGSPVMAWMVSNVVCHRDNKDNIYPRKEKVENKIDGVIAAIMALCRANTESDEKPKIDSIYNKRSF